MVAQQVWQQQHKVKHSSRLREAKAHGGEGESAQLLVLFDALAGAAAAVWYAEVDRTLHVGQGLQEALWQLKCSMLLQLWLRLMHCLRCSPFDPGCAVVGCRAVVAACG